MGCGNCGSATDGKPSGCKSNGGCSTGGCNRLNVFDWLSTLPLHDSAKPYGIIEVSFNKGSRKEFFRNGTHLILEKNDWITVEGVGGFDVGQVSLTGELVKLQMKKYGITEPSVLKRVLHATTEEEFNLCSTQKEREPEMLIRSRAIARGLNLDMKLCEVEVQADGKKSTFFYTADQRVDFRELIKLFANDFKMKIEMRQIGARQESAKVGGIGSCGRELCCSTWLSDFKSVNTTAARYQNLSINQAKLSGQCGRLKCCLNYELDTYMDALSVFPDHADHLETTRGVAHLQKRDIFKNLMWYSFSDNNKQYPMSIVRVKEIIKLNKAGQKAEELQPVEIEVKTEKGTTTVDMGFVNDVGQISLKNLEKGNKKKKPQGNKPQGGGNAPREGQPGGQNSNRPQQGQGGNPNRPQQKQQNNNRKPNPNPQTPAVEGEAGEAKPNTQPPRNNQGQGQKQNPNQGPRPNQNPNQQPKGSRPDQPNRRENRPNQPTDNPQEPKPNAGLVDAQAPQAEPKGDKPQQGQQGGNQQPRPEGGGGSRGRNRNRPRPNRGNGDKGPDKPEAPQA